MNKIFLSGNLTRDVEMRHTPQGTAIANLSLAVNRSFKDKSGEWQKDVSYFQMVAWGKNAEAYNENLTKGQRVVAEGELRQDRWEDKEGRKQSKVYIVIHKMEYKKPENTKPEGEI